MVERILKINEFIAQELSLLFERELSLKPGVLATIARVDTTHDLRYTRVFVSAFPEGESQYVIRTLAHEKRNLQKKLHQKLVMKQKPKLAFLLDATESEADVVEKLLRTIAEESQNS
jgi:ribosome-binding factor A